MFSGIMILLIVISTFSCGNLNTENKGEVFAKQDTLIVDGNSSGKNKSKDSLISIIAVGDIMMGSNYPSDYSLPPDNGKYLLDSVKEILRSADLTFGNLEGTFLNKGGTPKRCNTPDNCVCFRMPEHYCRYLKDAGFDVMSLANNHSNDMGEEGKISTMKTLDDYSIYYAGYKEYPVSVFEINDIKYGFTAFAPNYATQNISDLPNAIKTVSELKKKCDILIVSFHGGAEGNSAQRVTRNREIFLGENRGNVYGFAHTVIDAGADIVFGHGPHVPRALELYKDKLIAYSLGNFCTYGKFSLSGPQGIAPLIKVYLDQEGNFVKGNIFAFKQIKRGIPVLDAELNAAKLIKSLTEKDFPESGLVITDEGIIKVNEKNLISD